MPTFTELGFSEGDTVRLTSTESDRVYTQEIYTLVQGRYELVVEDPNTGHRNGRCAEWSLCKGKPTKGYAKWISEVEDKQ